MTIVKKNDDVIFVHYLFLYLSIYGRSQIDNCKKKNDDVIFLCTICFYIYQFMEDYKLTVVKKL